MAIMNRRKMIIIAILLITVIFAKNISKECPPDQEISSCETLRTSYGFTYHVPLKPQTGDCEQGWYFLNGTFIVDPSRPDEKLGCVVAVTQESLTIRTCEHLQWQLKFEDPVFECKVDFTVPEQSGSATNDRSTSGGVRNMQTNIGIVIVGIVIVAFII